MHPLAVITGIILGSTVAIALGLAVVWLIYWLIGGDEPAMQREIPALRTNTFIFFTLAAVAGGAFYTQLVAKWWRWPSLAALLLLLALVGVYYWPE